MFSTHPPETRYQRSPSGTHPFFLRIADITIAVHLASIVNEIQFKGAIREFLVSPVEPDIVLQAGWDELREETDGDLIFDSGGVWKLYALNGSHLFRLTAPVFGPIPYAEVTFDQSFTKGEARLHRPFYPPERPVDPLEYPLDELILANYLACGKGVEVHACGIRDAGGKGHLFLGNSGAGKSTMARLWKDCPGITILSDDHIVLRQKEGKFWMHGTPWHGDAEFSFPDCASLSSIFFLERGRENMLVPVKTSESSGRMFACSFPPFYSKEGIEFTLGFLEKTLSRIPAHELRFVPGAEVVRLLQNLS